MKDGVAHARAGRMMWTGFGAAMLIAAAAGPATAQSVPEAATGVATSATDLANRMSPGWNLGNSLEAIGPGGGKVKVSQEGAWGNPPVTLALMKAVRAAGFRSIRIPVAWNQYADADDRIGKAWLDRVAQVIDDARKADLYVVVNVHWDGGWLQPTRASQPVADARLKTFWQQIATRFADYDEHVLFAGTNEIAVKDVYTAPTAENCAVQNGFNQIFVDTVRATGGRNAARYLVVQGYNTNIDHTVACNAVLPRDPATGRMMMEVHYYDPYDFTLNASSKIWQWGAIAKDPAAVQPWANEPHVDAQFQKMKTLFADKGVPVILGEYAASMKSEYDPKGQYRLYWDAYITRSARKHGMVPMYWDSGYTDNHQSGLFVRARAKPAYPAIISAIVDMGR